MRLDHVFTGLQITDIVEALEERQPCWICWPRGGSCRSPSDTCNEVKWTRTLIIYGTVASKLSTIGTKNAIIVLRLEILL
jgi:hypothetical protein